ncbi:Rho GTPase activation protein, partial [Phyllosticta citricarpa]
MPPTTAQANVPGRNWDPPPESQSGDVPSKRDLASWWRQFKRGSAKKDEEKDQEKPKGIFGVPLQESIKYANVAISLFNEQGESYIYGYVPIVVAKCGVYLKEKAVDVEGIFRLSGSEKRIKELREAFNSPDRYGKGLDWAGYTVHDAANILRRYFNQLPEPIIPLEFYERFREPLRDHQSQAVGPMDGQREAVGEFDMDGAIREYQRLITELPPLNRQLLLYILDLLAVFASKSDLNKMTTANLAAIFQPGILSHPNHDMSPPDYRLSQDVLIFLIENQDNFLIGMQGTAADQETVDEVESGPPSPTSKTPVTPNRSKTHSLGRSTSNASAGAESVRQQGILRRNVSVSSRKSKASGSVTAASPASGASTGLHRSNTVPSKRSPGIIPQRFSREYSESHNSPRSPAVASLSIPEPNRPFRPPPSPTHITSPPSSNDTTPLAAPPSVTSATGLLPNRETPQKGRGDNSDREMPGGFRSFTNMFSSSPGSDTEQKEKRKPNKLQKKRAPSTNPSAASSTHSLHGTLPGGGAPPSPLPPNVAAGTPIKEQTQPSAMPESSPPKQQQVTSANPLQPSMSPSASTRSHSTTADYSEIEHGDEASNFDHAEKDRKRHWRISHKKEPSKGVTEHGFGSNPGAEQSMSSFGSRGGGGRKSLNIEPHEASIWSDASREAEKKAGPIEWFRGKLAERKEREDAKQRAKSPP